MEETQKNVSLIIVLSVGGMLLLMGLADLIFGLNPPLFLAVRLLSSLPFLVGFFLLKRYGNFGIGLLILNVYGLILAVLAYKFNGGFDGPVFFTLSAFLAFTSTIFNGWLKFFMLFLTFAIFTLLYASEVNGWLIVNSKNTASVHPFFESFLIICFSGLFSFLAIHYWVMKYREKNQSLLIIQEEKEKALQELSSLNTKKNQLIALLSHDLKNPIGMLSQTLDLVEKGAFEERELKQVLTSLKSQSYHLSSMLNNTLSWVLAELEDRKLQKQKVSLYQFTDEMKEVMLAQSSSKNQSISCEINGPDLVLEIETTEIRIILKNLLDNAIKFSSVDDQIEFNLFSSAKEIRWVVINGGKLIQENEVPLLFEFSVKTTFGTMGEKGTGIGLPLCKKIADKLKMELSFSKTSSGKNSFSLIKKLD